MFQRNLRQPGGVTSEPSTGQIQMCPFIGSIQSPTPSEVTRVKWARCDVKLFGERPLSATGEIRNLAISRCSGLPNRIFRVSPVCNSAPHVPESLLLRMLAHRMQANLFGGLDEATIRFLDRVATDRSLQGTSSLLQPDTDRVRAGACWCVNGRASAIA
jgi:hypothetical protein